MSDATRVAVRYIVEDVDESISFYGDHLGFTVDMHPGPGFAALSRGPLQLFINAVGGGGGASQQMADGARPQPGGWNRIQLPSDDLDEDASRLREAGATLRSEIIEGRGGRQLLVADPSGNLVELFERARG